ncbi:MAG: hypothetical protein E2O65_12040 [Gammaproteobacteria bacterium]|nr:MAG: hypothetical protein E2O65_12040 [Gammaproteobacteria bacterium]
MPQNANPRPGSRWRLAADHESFAADRRPGAIRRNRFRRHRRRYERRALVCRWQSGCGDWPGSLQGLQSGIHDSARKLRQVGVCRQDFRRLQVQQVSGGEGALVYLGTANANGTFLGVPTTSDVYTGGLELAGTGTVPITDQFGIIGKLGVLFWGTHSEVGTGFQRDDNGTSFALGAGLKYDITKNVGIRLEWERFWGVGNSTIGESDVDLFTIGGLYRFR